MASSETIYVEGLTDLRRALAKVEGDLKSRLRIELKEAAEIVREAAAAKLAGLAPSASSTTLGGLRARVSGPQAIVDQRLSKTTGTRGDWGATQMRLGLVPARSEKYEEVRAKIDVMLDHLADEAGF